MILNTVRIVADWLAGDQKDAAATPTDQGVNAQIQALTTAAAWGNDSPPADLVAVLDETRNRALALDKFPPGTALPLLLVTQNAPADVAGEVSNQVTRDGDLMEVAVRYLANDAESDEAVTRALQTMRATVRSIRQLMRSENYACRTRNGVQIKSAKRITYGLVSETIGGLKVQAALILAFEVRDLVP